MLKESKRRETLNQIGEREILNRLKKFMDIGQIEDDTATITTNKKELLINTDVLVDDVHFNEKTTCPENIGWKAIAANISDLTASGLDQLIGVTVALITPPDTEWSWVNGVYRGMKEALDIFGGKLLGGDCSQGKQKIISITAIGSLGPLRLHRSYAEPGDYLVTSGPHGLSRLGLALLQSEQDCYSENLTEKLKIKAIQAHQKPFPPYKELEKLISCKPKDIPWRAAGTDSSDGLLEALNCLSISSNCTLIIDRTQIPKEKEWPVGSIWEKWCLNGGEDFQLVLSLPPSWANAWIKLVPFSKKIGEAKKGKPKIIWQNGQEIDIEYFSNFKHF